MVRDVVEGYVAWPTHLIEPCQKASRSKGKISKQASTSGQRSQTGKFVQEQERVPKFSTTALDGQRGQASTSGHRSQTISYHQQLLNISPSILGGEGLLTIPLDSHIYNVAGLQEYVTEEVLNDILSHGMLSASIINIWIRHLFHDYMGENERSRYIFVNPFLVGVHRGTVDTQAQSNAVREYFTQRVTDEETQFLVPYCAGEHWILIVIKPAAREGPHIYYLDPLRYGLPQNRPDMKWLFNSALTAYRASINLPYSRSLDPLKSYNWKKITCPFQPNNIECGYYIMKFMKDIIINKKTYVPQQYFQDERADSLTEDQINQIVEEWCQYLITHIT